MRERKRGNVSDGICWYCPDCKTTKSIREGSFFTKRLPLKKWMMSFIGGQDNILLLIAKMKLK